jgi:hypothetical protein
VNEPGTDEDAPRELVGPDFSDWPRQAADMWKLVIDIEACDRILAAMNGPIAQDAGAHYEEARRFLMTAGQQLRAALGVMICARYGVTVREEQDDSPFAGAGRPRAFGTDPQPRSEA